jgi:aldehyde dehydrogenase (NAD+)
MVTKYQNYINGEWVDSSSGETYSRVNPANPEEVLGEFQKSNAEDIKQAVDAAQEAFDSWSKTPAPQRAVYLFKVGQLLAIEKEELARTMTWEMGKTLPDSRGDVQEAIELAYYAAGEGKKLFGLTYPSEKVDKFAMTIRVPMGVAGLITPWNFPIAIPGRKIFFALIAGNTAVFKPASDTPICAIRLMQLFEKAKLPKGVLNLVTGPGGATGTPLVKDDRVQVVGFTGSKETGQSIQQAAGLKKTNLELGGKNPLIVLDDADLKLAVNGALWGGYETTGQRCTAASRIIVHEKIKDTFEKMLLEQVQKIRLGNGLEEGVNMGPLINKAAQEKVSEYVQIGKDEGAKLITGGHIPENLKGWFFEPTLFTDCSMDMRVAKEEIFGPVVTILPAKNMEEAFEIANNTEYGLSSSIYTNNIRNAFRAIYALKAGLTYVNNPTIGSEPHVPFGGIKASGNSRENGTEGIIQFTDLKTIYINYSDKLQRAHL